MFANPALDLFALFLKGFFLQAKLLNLFIQNIFAFGERSSVSRSSARTWLASTVNCSFFLIVSAAALSGQP